MDKPPPSTSDSSTFPRPSQSIRAPIWGHVLPFLAWLFVMQMLGDPAGWKYAVRSALCLGLLLAFRPWRYYRPPQWRHVPLALATGILVFGIWILFETPWMDQWPAVRDGYLLVGTWPPWKIVEPDINRVYAPLECGWFFTLTRIGGSALVIAVIEEFFWRGFLYRWLLDEEFVEVDLGRFELKWFVLAALFFGLEHYRWLAGLVAGLAYGWIMIRTRDIWAAGIAHAVTNLLLGLYVVWADQYQFWS